MAVNTPVTFLAKLESDYAAMRMVQVAHDATDYRCIGSGNCCRIGLRIPLAECANIAVQLRRQHLLLAEREGKAKADSWFNDICARLVQRMADESWQTNGETKEHCAFLGNGCEIYEYRPMVCRAYGTIMPVANSCPRQRQPDGTDYVMHDGHIEDLIYDHEKTVKQFVSVNKDTDYSVYMPLGVLKYLMSDSEMRKLYEATDARFWTGLPGYPHRFRPESWIDDSE